MMFKKKGIQGAQIDFLISRSDKVVTICEMKFSNAQYTINEKTDIDLRNKVDAFINATDYKETVQLVLITPHGVKDNEYSSVIQNQVKMTDLFYEWL